MLASISTLYPWHNIEQEEYTINYLVIYIIIHIQVNISDSILVFLGLLFCFICYDRQ